MQNFRAKVKDLESKVKLAEEQSATKNVEIQEKRRLNGKQPSPAYFKEIQLNRFEDEEDDACFF